MLRRTLPACVARELGGNSVSSVALAATSSTLSPQAARCWAERYHASHETTPVGRCAYAPGWAQGLCAEACIVFARLASPRNLAGLVRSGANDEAARHPAKDQKELTSARGGVLLPSVAASVARNAQVGALRTPCLRRQTATAQKMLVSGCTPPLLAEETVAKPRRAGRCVPHACADRPARQLWTSQPRSPARGRGRTHSAAPGRRPPATQPLLVPLAVPQGTHQQKAAAPVDDKTCDSLIAVSARVGVARWLSLGAASDSLPWSPLSCLSPDHGRTGGA